MNESIEIRRVNFADFEVREAGDGMSFRGYAAVFDSPSEPLPFIERIKPGAFSKSLRSRATIKMYLNHDSTRVLGSTRAKTLRLQEDSHGLLAEADLPQTTDGQNLAILMKRGDVDSMSFGFTVPAGGDKWSADGMERELRQIRLHEVSVVTGFPAYPATTAQVRSIDALATRTGADVDALADAITMLEAGMTLNENQASLLTETVAKLRNDDEVVPQALDMKRKQLDLLLNEI